MVVDAQNPDPSPATFPAAAETVPLSCALRASDRNRVSRICVLVKDVSATAHWFSLPFSRDSRPLTNVYSACCPAEKPSGNFTNQRQRWSRRAFHDHKPLTSVGTVPSSAEPTLLREQWHQLSAWLRFRTVKPLWYASSGGLVTGIHRRTRELRRDPAL